MAAKTVIRYQVQARPKSWTPFKRGKKWNPTTKKYDSVWVTQMRRLYAQGNGFTLRHGNGATGLMTPEMKDRARKVFERKGWVVTVKAVEVKLYPNLTGDMDCHSDLLRALNLAAKDLGVKIHIASGMRTIEEQRALRADYLAGRGPLAAVPNANAPHVRGIAADCQIDGVNILSWNPEKVRAVFKKRGLCCPVTGEFWHSQLTKDTPGTKWAV